MANPMPANEAVAAAARECGRDLLVRLPGLSAEWAELFVAAEPRLASGADGFAIAVLGVEEQSGAVLSVLAFGLPLSAVELSPASVRSLRRAVAQGADLAALLRLYNEGQQFGWQM